MESNKLLVFVMPTNEPDTFDQCFRRGLDNFLDMKDFCTFNFNFQPPWTQDRVDEVVNEMIPKGFKVEYKLSPKYVFERGYVPFNRIRNDAVITDDAKFYALLDDDMEFRGPSATINKTAGQQYLDVLDYLTNHDNCGVVLMGGTMFRKVPRNNIGLVDVDTVFTTGKGYVCRSLRSIPKYSNSPTVLLTEDTIDLKGACEEKLMAAIRLKEGLYPAKMGFSRTRHTENYTKVVRGKEVGVAPGGEEMYGWLEKNVLEENIHRYIRDNFYEEEIREKVNLMNMDKCISRSLYESLGGIVYNQENYDLLISNYDDPDYDSIKSGLLSYVGDN